MLFLPFVSFPLRVKEPQQSQIVPVGLRNHLIFMHILFNTWFPVTLTVNSPFLGFVLFISLDKIQNINVDHGGSCRLLDCQLQGRRGGARGKKPLEEKVANLFVKAEKRENASDLTAVFLLCVVPTCAAPPAAAGDGVT